MLAGKNPEPRRKHKNMEGFNYQVQEYISLPKVQNITGPLFFEVLINRKSERAFKRLTLEQLSNILWHSAKTKKIIASELGTVLSHRTSPSAGAIHPIDIFISLPVPIELRILYYYDPFAHRLATLKLSSTELKLFFENINSCLSIENATLIWFVAHPDRTAVKYENSESLVWRDAGALTMTVQLVATAFNIKSCTIGTLGEPFLSQSFENKLFSAGGLLLG